MRRDGGGRRTAGVGKPGWVRIRSHFKRYIGLYVLHYHILGQENLGMMEIFEVE
jgi:FtsP/CotA-like multicopper oxidase with cupredoxin domain